MPEEIIIGFYEEDIDDLISACYTLETELRRKQEKILELRTRIDELRKRAKEQKK